jgi:predicted DNA binding protein
VVKLNNDWTRSTSKVNANFESLAWYPVKSDHYGEIVLFRWADRKRTPSEYFYDLLSDSLIDEVLGVKNVYGPLYLIVFIGPVKDTVRHKIIRSGVTHYRSSISGGCQKWEIISSKDQLKSIVADLSAIGKITTVYKQSVETSGIGQATNLLLSSFLFPNLFSTLILTEKELKILQSAIDESYFDKGSKVIIEEIAKNQRRNKSTVDRELKNAINKLIKILFWQKNFQ